MLEKYNVCNSGGPSIFEKEGTNPRDRGANLLFGKNFAENCMEKKEIGPRVGKKGDTIFLWDPVIPDPGNMNSFFT